MYQITFNFKGSRKQTIVEFSNFISMYAVCQEIKNVVDGDILTFKKDSLGYYRLDTSLLDIKNNVLKTYLDNKRLHTDSVVLCRNGMYYSYGNDAREICNITGIMCHNENELGLPMCCFPSFKLDEFFHMIVRKGMKICICDLEIYN